MQKAITILAATALFTSCMKPSEETVNEEKQEIGTTLDDWHKAAAEANYDDYFNELTDDAIFIGTDATENWDKTAFQKFAKPFFERRKAWNFTPLERHIYFNEDLSLAWFDELLDTQMKICRGSGVMVKTEGQWKIKHYVLSMTVPNDNITEVVKAKSALEDKLVNQLRKQ